MEQDLPFSFALFGPGLDGRLVRVLKSACSVTAQQKANGDIQYVHNGRTIDVETVVNTVFSNIVSKVRDAQGSIRTLGFVVPDHFSVLRRAALFRMVKGNLLNEDVKVKLVNQSATIAASCMKHVPEKCNMLIVRIGHRRPDSEHLQHRSKASDSSYQRVGYIRYRGRCAEGHAGCLRPPR